MFKFDFWFKISSSFFFYPFYLAILSYQFLKLLFIEFSGVGIYCSVIKVLFVVVFQFSATTSSLYHIVSCLSTTFLFFSTFSLVVCCISFSENQFTMLCFPCQHLFVYFFYTIQTLSFFPARSFRILPQAETPLFRPSNQSTAIYVLYPRFRSCRSILIA